MRLLHRFVCLLAVLLASEVQARAGVSYDESAVFSFDTRDYLAGLAAESAVFSFDTRAVDGLQGAAVSGSFAFDTRGTTLPPLQIAGVLRDSAGVPVVGATIQIKRAGAIFWQGVSGAGGAFTTPNLSGVNYTVIVTKPGYVTSITNIIGTAGGSLALNIALQALPASPIMQTTNRTPTTAETAPPVDPTASKLMRYNAVTGQFTATAPLLANLPTVVLTHGWLSDPEVWARDLASLILVRSNALGATPPNIVAWDWHTKAAFAQMPVPSTSVSWSQGIELGKALQQSPLGTGYNHHLHFIGHSLGALVNSAACDYLHHGFLRNYANSPTPWDPNLTMPHATLLDEAEVVQVGGALVTVASQVAAMQADSLSAITQGITLGIAKAAADWKQPVPKTAKWADSYISEVGIQRQDAVNVCLLKPAIFYDRSNPLSYVYAHAYAHEWYRDSINPTGVPPAISFGLSLEAGAAFPPTGAGRMPGDLWLENLATLDPFDELPSPTPTNYDCNILILSAFLMPPKPRAVTQTALLTAQIADPAGRAVMAGYETGIQLVGDVGGTVIFKSGQVLSASKEKVGQLWDAAHDFATDVLNSIEPDEVIVGSLAGPAFSMTLQTQAALPLAGKGAALNGGAATPGQPANAWMTVSVPANAGLMAFDFTVTGEPQEDCVACAVNGQNVFALPAKFAPDGSPVSTDMMDVSAYAGQSVEFFFGLVGGTSTNCAVTVDGIRFITIPQPKVGIVVNGANTAVKWPAAAVGWILETSDTLAADSWQVVPLAGVMVEQGVATLVQPVVVSRKFYRLRRGP